MKQKLCIFGEVLFDHFPDGNSVLGGAPFNVAWHLQAFGCAPLFISRVGDDAEGESVRSAMQRWGMDTSGLQTDATLPTGKVDVSLIGGEPSYDIVNPCAYDAIEKPEMAKGCRWLYHGSLALREPASMRALKHITDEHPGTVFLDVNLRPPWWQREKVLSLVGRADWVKLNGDELDELAPGTSAADFLDQQGLRGLLVTHGAKGAEVLTAAGESFTVEPERANHVVDTVGAGDAFASVMILGLVRGWHLTDTLKRAQTFASRIVGNRGATVDDPAFYAPLIKDWNL